MRLHVISAAAALTCAAPLAAQCDFGARTFTFPSQVAAVLTKSDNPNFLVLTSDTTRLWGGSLRPLRVTELSRPNPIAPVGVGRIPVLVNEQGTGNYWGLNVKADFVPLVLPAAANQVSFGQELVMLEGNGAVHVFGHWLDSFTSTPVTGPVTIHPGRALMVANDGGSRLLGYSWFSGNAASIYTIPASGYAAHIPGTGEGDTRRNAQAFETDTREITVYSPYTNAWHPVTTTSEARSVTLAYDKNVILMQDAPANEFVFFSDITGTSTRITVTDATNVATATQDFGAYVIDRVNGNSWLFRAIDGGLVFWPGVGNNLGNGDAFTNNLWAIPVLDGTTQTTDYWACSTSVRGAQFVAAGAAGETVVRDGGNDNTFVLVTDRSLYGFSAFTNRWTKLPTYQGSHVTSGGEDFIGFVETSSHVYVYSPRENRWQAHTKGPGYAGFDDSDFVVAIDEGTRKVAYGTDSVAFVSQPVSGTKLTEFNSNTYHCAVHDDAVTGGSTIHMFQGFADRWITLPTTNRLTTNTPIQQLEDSVIVEDGNRIHVLTSFTDLTSQWGAPNDNYAWHATPGVNGRFFAAGAPNGTAAMLIGVNRLDTPLGLCNPLMIDPTVLVAAPIGSYDALGRLRFDIPMPTGTGVLRLQMVGLAGGSLQLGRALTFEIH